MIIDLNRAGRQGEGDDDEIDFALVNQQARSRLLQVLEHWMPGGTAKGGEYVCGDKFGGAGESCSTNLTTGVGSDFASGEKWGDPVDMVAQIDACSMLDAAHRLREFCGGSDMPERPQVVRLPTVEERRETALKSSWALWMQGEKCPDGHPYLQRKQVRPDPNIRYHPDGYLMIPLRDGMDLLGVQRIWPDGTKKVNSGGRVSGCYHTIVGEPDTVFVCEGYATGMTLHIATGKTVVVAVSAGNLPAVAVKVDKLFPRSRLVLAADNDQTVAGNPGVTAAKKAVAEVGRGEVLFPPYPQGSKGDWNDYALEHGGAALQQLVLARRRSDLLIDVTRIESRKPQWLIERFIETPGTGMVFGPSGAGKSFFVLDLALCVASGRKWLNLEVRGGLVIYICGEGRHGIPRRVKAWEQHRNTRVPANRFFITQRGLSFDPEAVGALADDVRALVEEVGGTIPAMIVVDTLARALPGQADENSARDSGLFVAQCDRLQQEFNCVVLAVHHSGHVEGSRARGSSALKGAMDFEYRVQNGRIECTKMKDAEPHSPIGFLLKPVKYGDDEHESSCVLEYELNVKKVLSGSTTTKRKQAREAVRLAIEREGLDGRCSKDGIIDCYMELFAPEKSREAVRKTLFRNQDGRGRGEVLAMIEDGELMEDGGFFVLAEEVTNAMFPT